MLKVYDFDHHRYYIFLIIKWSPVNRMHLGLGKYIPLSSTCTPAVLTVRTTYMHILCINFCILVRGRIMGGSKEKVC